MSDYWKKKLKELEQKEEKTPSNFWQKKIAEVENSNNRKVDIETAVVPIKDKGEEDDTKWYNKWLKKGAFADGWQWGDVTKTLYGTLNDVSENVNTAVFDATENLIDTTAYAYGQVASLWDENAKEDVSKFIAKEILHPQEWGEKLTNFMNWVQPAGLITKMAGINDAEDTEAYSILDDKADSLTQSAAHMLGSRALNMVGVPWQLTTAVNSFGSELENSLNQGATFDEAGVSGAVNAGLEIVSEMLFKGSALGEKGLFDTSVITKGIKKRVVKSLASFGVDLGAEGAEEVVAQFGSNLTQLLYRDDKDIMDVIASEEAWNGYADAAIGGIVMSFGGNAAKVTNSIKNGTDYNTGLTENEEKVLNKEVERRIAKEESKGKKLTKKQKDAIMESVYNEMNKGQISTDTIEETLGGDTYKSYKNAIDSENAIREEYEAAQKEYDKLTDMKRGDMTGKEQQREAELAKRIEELKAQIDSDDFSANSTELKQKLGKEVFGVVKDSRLVESYNERARRGVAFEADVSKYDAKQQAVIQKAIDSGILNNTRRTHEFVDMIAKISADKGVLFDFANNDKLKESGFAVENAQVNGFVDDAGNITLNIDSSKSLNTVTGHEITHILEGTELYNEFQRVVEAYARNKGEYDSRLTALKELYKGKKGYETDFDAKVKAELTADLVGDYLFTDENFIRRLSTEHRNVFQKIYDEVKYLCRVATAGSKEAQELERVKRAFEKAYKESGTASGDTKYSLAMVEEVQPKSDKWHRTLTTEEAKARFPKLWDVAAEESDVRNPTQISSTVKSYRKVYDYLKGEGFNGTILDASSGLGYGTKAGIEEYGFDVEDIEPYPDASYTPKYKDYSTLDKKYDVVISNAVLNVLPQDQRDALVVKMGEMLNDGGRIFINVRGKDVDTLGANENNTNISHMEWFVDSTGSYQKGFTKTELVAYLQDALGDGFAVKPTSMFGAVSAIVTKDGGVKYSLTDTDGKKLTAEQQEYFKDSKMRDDNGNLKVMYHGSQDAGFHEFMGIKSDDGMSFFFVDSNDVAASYSGTSEVYEARTIHTADDMNDFIAEIGAEGYEVVEKDGKFVLLYEDERIAESNTAKGIYDEFCWYEGVGEGDANYKVYLNLKNPLVVDAEGRNWNNVTREFSQELYDKYHSLTEAEKAALTNLASWEDVGIFRDELRQALADAETGTGGSYDAEFARNVYSAYEKLGGNSVNMYDLFTIASDNFAEETVKQFAVKQMSTRDFAKKAKADGYDGVIFKNIVDVGGYGGTYAPSTVAIAFESNQIKSVANEKPTADADIRFSLSKSVEETDKLVAAHNLQSSELLKSFELGGLPMPSIAITKANAVHDEYGDVTLILHKDAIDPKKSRYNKVYGGDAWTPTYPTIEYKPNEKVAKRIRDKYYGLAKEVGYDAVRPMYSYVNELEDTLNRYRGEAAMLEKLYDDTGMMQVYLLDSGKGKVETVQKEIRTELTDADVEMREFFLTELGADVVSGVMLPEGATPRDHIKQYWENHGETIKEAYKKLLSQEYGFTEEEVQNVLNSTKMFDYLTFVRDAYKYKQDGRVTTKTEADIAATDEAIKKAAGEGYKAWVDNLFGGVEEKSGIRNNADYYTPSGNPRSWNALHWENTLENVVKVMRQHTEKGADAIFGGTGIWAVSAKDYKSIEEVKADSHRLRKMSEEEYEAVKNTYAQRYNKIAEKIADKSERNWFIAHDNAMEAIVDAVRTSKTKAGILNELKQYRNLNVTEADVDEIVSLVSDIAEMPTGYFEAKPRRAVGFEEVGVFVIPRNADAKLKQELLNRGYSIAEYDPDVEGDRQRVVNQFEEYKFSLSKQGETPKTYGNYNVRGKDIALETAQEVAPVQETATADEIAPTKAMTADDMISAIQDKEFELQGYDRNAVPYAPTTAEDANAMAAKNLRTIRDADAPPEVDAPIPDDHPSVSADDPFLYREWDDRKTKAFITDHPDAKPFFREAAERLSEDYSFTQPAERGFSGEAYYNSNGEKGFWGWGRKAAPDINALLDEYGLSYSQIAEGLDAILNDTPKVNNKAAKTIEMILNDRLLNGYEMWHTREYVPPHRGYIEWLNEQQHAVESSEDFAAITDADAPIEETVPDIAPVAETPVAETLTVEDVAPIAETTANNATVAAQTAIAEEEYAPVNPQENGDATRAKQRKWVGTSTDSEVVNREVLPDDLDQDAIHYQPIPNKVTLGNANARLNSMGYNAALTYFNSQFVSKKVTLDDIALGERLIQEAIRIGDKKTAGELIQNVSILGTELGQKVQALSIIKRMTPEGQLKMLQKMVERGKAKGDEAYDGVVVTQDMVDNILGAYSEDGSYDQDKLNAAIEDAKQKLADQMKVTFMDKVNAWRYLSMLGNPKTHIRNLVSNVAMRGTLAVKNAVARTVEGIVQPDNRTKTWKRATDAVKAFAEKTTTEMQDVLQDGGKYSEEASIKAKRKIFKSKMFEWLNVPTEANSKLLSKEDWWFSKPAFKNALSEFLTANGIQTEEDIMLNPEIVEKARQYATEQSQAATFRQFSWLANKINEIEQKNAVTQVAVGAVLPFKKTPINIAKTGLNYSPLGFVKSLTYDLAQVQNGKMETSEWIDHLAQNLTGTSLTLLGYMLASMGAISGGGSDDKEGKYDYQLGKQSYALNIGDKSYSLSWLSPVAMPLFVGANAYETLVEKEEWDGDVVVQTLAETLDPLSEMSFLSGLDSVLSSYESGVGKFLGIGEAMAQNYVTQFVPTLSSQVATVLDDTKRSTKASRDSGWRAGEETLNKIKFKIPVLRNTLEPSTDIWGNEVKQTENVAARALESFIAPYAVRENTATEIDEEIKGLYRYTGDTGVLPSVPYNYVNYKDEKYEMSAEEFTAFKKTYGQTSYEMLSELFDTNTYRNSDPTTRAELVNKVYDYARDEAMREYLSKRGVQYTNSTEDDVPVYKENAIKGAIYHDVTPDEYTFMKKYPKKHKFFTENGISFEDYNSADEDGKRAYTWAYENPEKMPLAKAIAGDVVGYRQYASELYDIKADKDASGKSISGSRKEKVIEYVNNLDADYGERIILFKSEYPADDTYNYDIIEYLNGREDISYDDMVSILKELGFTVTADGTIYWD